jgi:uncharacterized protein (TIGR00730 family)
MQRLCVFCGSNVGDDAVYVQAARSMGKALAAANIGLVYGGGSVGLMGAIADAVLEAGGQVSGVIPRALVERELGHNRLTELHIVGSMHERKALMAELSDGFVALPGGIGTLEELFEAWSWAQLGIHRKPCGLLNVRGFYDGLIAYLDAVAAHRFIKPEHRSLLIIAHQPDDLIGQLRRYRPPDAPAWLTPGEK